MTKTSCLEMVKQRKTSIIHYKIPTMRSWLPKRKKRKEQQKKEKTYSRINPEQNLVIKNNILGIYITLFSSILFLINCFIIIEFLSYIKIVRMYKYYLFLT